MVLAGVGAVFFFTQRGSEAREKKSEMLYTKTSKIMTSNERQKRRLKVKKAKAVGKREKPQIIDVEDEEYAKLNAFSKKLMEDLQAALDEEKFEKVRRIIAKLFRDPPDPKFGPEGVPALLRRNAVHAAGWFGAKGLPELVGLLADADPEIASEAFDQFSLALEDISLSDYERADIVFMAAKVLTDVDNLEVLFMEINNMRHSVGAGLLVDICQSGTDAAKSLMPEQIEFFTGEDNLVTVEDVEKWLQENPDGPDDEDLYGGDKEE